MATELAGLVDAERGLISRRIFIEPETYERELHQVFARCRLFLCRDSQVGRPPAGGAAREAQGRTTHA